MGVPDVIFIVVLNHCMNFYELRAKRWPTTATSLLSINDLPQIPDIPHHPMDLTFPKRTVMKLILEMPATNAMSEHAFSALCTIKSYLRSTMRLSVGHCERYPPSSLLLPSLSFTSPPHPHPSLPLCSPLSPPLSFGTLV